MTARYIYVHVLFLTSQTLILQWHCN